MEIQELNADSEKTKINYLSMKKAYDKSSVKLGKRVINFHTNIISGDLSRNSDFNSDSIKYVPDRFRST